MADRGKLLGEILGGETFWEFLGDVVEDLLHDLLVGLEEEVHDLRLANLQAGHVLLRPQLQNQLGYSSCTSYRVSSSVMSVSLKNYPSGSVVVVLLHNHHAGPAVVLGELPLVPASVAIFVAPYTNFAG